MKTILIITIGNRDLQIPPEASFPAYFNEILEKGGPDTDNFIIKKADRRFLENSKKILDNFEVFESVAVFPMIEYCLKEIEYSIDEVVIIATKQDSPDSQDCFYVAEFIRKKYEQNKNTRVNIDYINFPPVDFGRLVDFFSAIYERYYNDKIYVGNSGGTPDMRAASYFAGMFRNIDFITIQAREKAASINNFIRQEQLVLKHIIEKMLDNFDYSGIFQLPVDGIIVKYAEFALARLSLDHAKANRLSEELNENDWIIHSSASYDELGREVFYSAKIKYHQRAYADYLWRLFTIHDNVFIPIVEELLKGKVIYNKKNNHQEWLDILQKHEGLVAYLDQRKVGENQLNWKEPGKVVYKAVIDWFIENQQYEKPILLDYIDKNLLGLSGIRNDIAHYYKGINLELMLSKLVAKTFFQKNASIEALNTMICEYFNISSSDFGIYTVVNERIRRELK